MKKLYLTLLVLVVASLGVKADNWGEWEEYTTGTFDAHWWYKKPMKDLRVERRTDLSNKDRVQYKVCGMYGDTPGYPPIDLIINANFAEEGGPKGEDVYIWVDDQYIESYDINGEKTEIWVCDAYSYYDKYPSSDPTEQMQYVNSSYYRPETGTFVIYAMYHYQDGTVPFLDAFYEDRAHGEETLTLNGAEFKNYTAEFSNGRFEKVGGSPAYLTDVCLNDLGQIKMTVQRGASVNVRDIANAMDKGSLPCTTVTSDGTATIPFDGGEGDYTLVYLTYKADMTPYQMGSAALHYDPNWTMLGDGMFTDPFMSVFVQGDLVNNLGIRLSDEAWTYSVKVEESTETPGLYRIINPYGATAPLWDVELTNLKLDKKSNYSMIVNACDPERVYIPTQHCGYYLGSYEIKHFSEAATYLEEGYDAASVPAHLWGKLRDGVISFGDGTADDNVVGVSANGSPAPLYGRAMTLRLPGATSIVEIEGSVNAESVYYNLQGIRVDNPTHGIYIRRQGSKVNKVAL